MPAKTGKIRPEQLEFCLAGLLLIAPFLFLQNLLTELVQKDEAHLEILARENWSMRWKAFRTACNQINTSKRQWMTLTSTSICRVRLSASVTLPIARAKNPNLIDENFIESAKNFLKKNYQIQPFLMLAADCDLQHHWMWSSLKLFPDGSSPQLLCRSSSVWNELRQRGRKISCRASQNLSLRKTGFILKHMLIDNNPHQIFAETFPRLYFGIF